MLIKKLARNLQMQNMPKLFDIAANLADEKFNGIYYGKKHHQNDVTHVIERAKNKGVQKLLISSGHHIDCLHSYEICRSHDDCYGTIGIHPCRANEILSNENEYYQKMENLFSEFKDKTVAVGECGLDYDRQEYASKETQLKAFPVHFEWAEKYGLPMYFHSRNCKTDFLSILKLNRHRFSTGVVHSYTGDEEELKALLDMGLYVGVNGCSLKTFENVEIVKKIPLDRIMLETDSPYCDIRKTHEGAKYLKSERFVGKNADKYDPAFVVKSRNEPVHMIEVLEAVAGIKAVDIEVLATHAYENTCKVFNIK